MKIVEQEKTVIEFVLIDADGSTISSFNTQAEVDLAIRKINAPWKKVFGVLCAHTEKKISAMVYATHVAQVDDQWFYSDSIAYKQSLVHAKPMLHEWFDTREKASELAAGFIIAHAHRWEAYEDLD